MTTIAFDGKELVADNLVSNGGRMFCTTDKIKQIGGAYIAAAGCIDSLSLVETWWKSKSRKPPLVPVPEERAFDALIITHDKIIFIDKDFIPTEVQAPIAIGSGSHIALAAMLYGLSAQKAVKMASLVDFHTSDVLQVVKIK